MVTVLLAAGKASRMGESKLILPYKDKPILAHALESALAASERVIVVTGYHKESLMPILTSYAGHRLDIVENPNANLGQFSSTLLGVAEVEEGEVFTIAMGDAPLVTDSHYRSLVPLLSDFDAGRPSCQNIPGHPVLCAESLRKTILALPPTHTMRRLLSDCNVYRYDTDDPAWITDIDTPMAYEQLVNLVSD